MGLIPVVYPEKLVEMLSEIAHQSGSQPTELLIMGQWINLYGAPTVLTLPNKHNALYCRTCPKDQALLNLSFNKGGVVEALVLPPLPCQWACT